MTDLHDPLCPVTRCQCRDDGAAERTCPECLCSFIAFVRGDERAKRESFRP